MKMENLKTLKDLGCIHACNKRGDKYCDACGIEECHSIDEGDLRLEAKKWVTFLEDNPKKAVWFVKQFFNL